MKSLCLSSLCLAAGLTLSSLAATPEWSPLDFHDGRGTAKVSYDGGTVIVEGAARQEISVTAGSGPVFEASAEVFLPSTVSTWTSFSVALFGAGNDQRVYAMAMPGKPGLADGMTEVGFHEKSMKPKKLTRDAWVRIRVELNDELLGMKVWNSDQAEPTEWDVSLPANTISWEIAGYGPRSYGMAGRFRSLSAVRRDPPPPVWRTSVPEPVFSPDPTLVSLYYTAWKQAWAHVKQQPGIPRSPYMDEACWDDTIWIWDTCFMSLFCKYAPDRFPGVESLENFYVSMHGGQTSSLRIWHPDNPPLFAWVEHDNFKFLNNRTRIEKLIREDQYLQKHFDWFSSMSDNSPSKGSINPHLRAFPDGFTWSGVASGMDNTPRSRGRKIYWVDALAQQGLSALYISRMAEAVGDRNEASKWRATYEGIKSKINALYWDEKDGFYYDIDSKTREKTGIRTPAAFWPMLAEMCSKEQAARMVKHLEDSNGLGGNYPWVTLARNDKDFNPDSGDYWRGGIWLPTAYMGIKAIQKYGYDSLADETAWKLVQQMNATFKTYKPATIWECYSPSKPEPSTEHGKRARPDFCGWSALGPISLFIENIIGIRDVDAQSSTVRWRLTRPGEIGLKKLRFGGITTDLVHDGKGTVHVKSTAAYLLVINGQSFAVNPGEQSIALPNYPR